MPVSAARSFRDLPAPDDRESLGCADYADAAVALEDKEVLVTRYDEIGPRSERARDHCFVVGVAADRPAQCERPGAETTVFVSATSLSTVAPAAGFARGVHFGLDIFLGHLRHAGRRNTISDREKIARGGAPAHRLAE
jgi:hypothetical protein